MILRAMWVAATAAFVLGGLVGSYAVLRDTLRTPPKPVWKEVQWPFPADPWGKGKAYRCKASDCGTEVHVYIRAKLGFCNCTTGVSDDEELERIGDLVLLGNAASAQRAGRPISVVWMKGRSRPYSIDPKRADWSALSIGYNDRCDAIVATALVASKQPDALEPAVIEFLNSGTVMRWAEVTLGL